jgi:tetratricopeptide (TPR) repeat protein
VRLERRDETGIWASYAEAELERLDAREVRLARLERVEGVIAFLQKRYDEAQQHAERALALAERVPPEESGIHNVLTDLADIARDRAHFDEALGYYTRALAAAERISGPDHPDVAITLNNRGILFDELGRFPEALADYRRAMEIEERRLGPDHLFALNSVSNIGIVLAKSGHFHEARVMFERVLAAQEKQSPESEEVLTDLSNLAQILSDEGRSNESLQTSMRAMHLAGKIANDEIVAGVLQNYARALGNVGRWREALTAYEQAHAKWEKLHGGDHPDIVDSLVGQGRCRLELGQPARALAPLERAVALAAGPGVAAATAAEARFELARALRALHTDAPRAQALAKAAAEAYRKSGGDFVARAEHIDAWLAAH